MSYPFRGSRLDLEIDLLCVIARLEQIDDESDLTHWLWDRIINCDVPRLKSYLRPAVLEWGANHSGTLP